MVLLPSSDKVASHQQSSWLSFSISIQRKPYGLWINPLGLGPSLSAPRDWVEASPSPHGCAELSIWAELGFGFPSMGFGSLPMPSVHSALGHPRPLERSNWETLVWRGAEQGTAGGTPLTHGISTPKESSGHLCSQSSQLHRGGGLGWSWERAGLVV